MCLRTLRYTLKNDQDGKLQGASLAQCVEHVAFDPWVVRLSPTLHVEIALINKLLKKMINFVLYYFTAKKNRTKLKQ